MTTVEWTRHLADEAFGIMQSEELGGHAQCASNLEEKCVLSLKKQTWANLNINLERIITWIERFSLKKSEAIKEWNEISSIKTRTIKISNAHRKEMRSEEELLGTTGCTSVHIDVASL